MDWSLSSAFLKLVGSSEMEISATEEALTLSTCCDLNLSIRPSRSTSASPNSCRMTAWRRDGSCVSIALSMARLSRLRVSVNLFCSAATLEVLLVVRTTLLSIEGGRSAAWARCKGLETSCPLDPCLSSAFGILSLC